MDFLKQHKPDGLRWSLIPYYWPNLTIQNQGFFWLKVNRYFGGWKWKNTSDLADKIAKADIIGAEQSLLIYHGAISAASMKP